MPKLIFSYDFTFFFAHESIATQKLFDIMDVGLGLAFYFNLLVSTEPGVPTIKTSSRDVVEVGQRPVSIIIGDSLFTVSGTNLTISCSVDGKPIPKVKWMKGNQSLPSDGRMAVSGTTLTIGEVQVSDSGLYVCNASSAGGVTTAVSTVTVIGEFNCLAKRKHWVVR